MTRHSRRFLTVIVQPSSYQPDLRDAAGPAPPFLTNSREEG